MLKNMGKKQKRSAVSPLQIEEEFIQTFTFFCSRLGIGRTAAQVLAVIFLATGSDISVSADDIVGILSIARSTLSSAVAELESAGLIMSSTESGSKRLIYSSYKDAWEFYRAILRRRELLEVDRTLQMIRSARTKMEQAKHSKKSMGQVNSFEDLMTQLQSWLASISGLSASELRKYVTEAAVQFPGVSK